MRKIIIAQLYPKEMNIYGDMGNALVLQKRLQWRGLKSEIVSVNVGSELPANVDIIIGGGGQDASQMKVEHDIRSKAKTIKKLAHQGVPMLMICGLYQLFGNSFVTSEGKEIKGIGVFDLKTVGGHKRMIGNICIDTDWGRIVGYENHSGRTFLSDKSQAIGVVVKGDGNNGEDGMEGCRVNNVFGSYLHGPILSKNPKLADELICLAIERIDPSFNVKSLDDSIEEKAHNFALKRPR